MNDYNYDYNPNPEPLDPEPAHSGMETAAIILGILALVGSTCFYLSIPCAAVGILLALLSRGRKEHMSNRAKTGLCISAAGLVLTVGLTSYTLYHYRDLFSSSEFQQRMKDYMDYYYSGSETEAEEDGESNILKDFFGDDKGNSSDGEQQTPETEITRCTGNKRQPFISRHTQSEHYFKRKAHNNESRTVDHFIKKHSGFTCRKGRNYV